MSNLFHFQILNADQVIASIVNVKWNFIQPTEYIRIISDKNDQCMISCSSFHYKRLIQEFNYRLPAI